MKGGHMITRITKLVLVAFFGLSLPLTVFAAGPSYLDAGAKARGEFGTTRNESRSNAVMYRAAPQAVAQAPTTERRFSYEPSQAAPGSGCPTTAQNSASSNSTAQRSVETRRFSYEPNLGDSGFSVRSQGSSQLPLYALPRTDGRKLGGR